MALHLFRPADPPDGYLSPSWRAWRGLVYVAAGRLLNWAASLLHKQPVRQALHTCLIVLALVVQGMLLLTAAYLVDLALSLMELWADLARKHLELTL